MLSISLLIVTLPARRRWGCTVCGGAWGYSEEIAETHYYWQVTGADFECATQNPV